MTNVKTGWNPQIRPRRLRRTEALRRMVRETRLEVSSLIAPLFVVEGAGVRESIASMPGQYRLSVDELLREVETHVKLGVSSFAIFPAISDHLKNSEGTEGWNPEGLFPSAIRAVKEAFPETLVFSDVALDPYSSDGHDGVVREGEIVNDETLALLTRLAVTQAAAGADFVAPSDMMDGRVGVLRRALDDAGFAHVGILSYTAKYASALYGPFRDALDSAPRQREDIPKDKQSYQMDPANALEAERETDLDIAEGADMVMVKPAGMYLDVIRRVKQRSSVPVAAYQVSGEYAMIHAAAERGYLDLQSIALESLLAIRRAGADVLLTYFAADVARWLHP